MSRTRSKRNVRAAKIMADVRFAQLAALLYGDNELAVQHQAAQLAAMSRRQRRQALMQMEHFTRLSRQHFRGAPVIPIHQVQVQT